MTQPPLIDHAVFDDLVATIGEAGGRAIVELFIEESRNYLAAIAEAGAEPGDSARRERARRAAHSLKSGAGQLGAAAMAAAAAAVERAAGENGAGLGNSVAALQRCAGDTVAALGKLAAPSSGGSAG